MNSSEAPRPVDARRLLLERLRQQRRAATGGGAPGGAGGAGGVREGGAGGPAASGPERAELSFAQQRLWFLDQWSPGNLAYVIPVALRLSGDLDTPALDAALQALVERHAALRTTYPSRDGVPSQLVHAHGRVRLEVTDLRQVPEADREAEALHRAREAVRVPFDLAVGPVLRAALFRLDVREHLLLLAVHHIASDGWSTNRLLADLAAAYTSLRRGEAAALPALPVQYADYARWQRRSLTDEVLRGHLDHWASELRGAPTILDLPTDRPRPPVQTFNGAVHSFAVPAQTTERLRTLCDAQGVTLFMGLLAAFAVLLRRYSGQDDLLIGTPVANRTRAEYEQVVGLFVNTLALRVECTGDPTFTQLLARVRHRALSAYERQDVPFERLVDHLRLDRDPARSPLTQVLFAMQYPRQDDLGMAGLTTTPIELEAGTTTSDLVLNVQENGAGLDGFVEYNTDLFAASSIERMFANYLTLLADATADPDRPLSQLRLLSPDEERLVLREWNQTGVAWPAATIPELFAQQVEAAPDACAVACDGVRLSYRELDERATLLAGHLTGLGVGPETLVGVFLERSAHLMIALLAILKAGGAYVPLDPDYPADRLAYMVRDSAAPLVLTSFDLLDRVPDLPAPVLAVDTLALPGNAAACTGASGAAVPDATAANLAYMIYTSGSTGRPKGVQITHRGVVNHLRWLQATFPLGAEDRVVQKTSICFDVSVWELFWPLTAGATLVLAKPGGHRDPQYVADLIRAEDVTVAYFVPSMLRAFLDATDLASCTSLRLLFCGGEALPVELQNRLLAAAPVRLVNIYGPTEASIDATSWECQPGWTQPTVPIGGPVANTQLYVLDGALRPLPIGVPGELYIGGVQLARGYGNRPELTAERFISDPFAGEPDAHLYRTGDLVRWLPDGVLEFLGRNDDQIKLRGLRIELGEIESCLASHPAVAECALTVSETTPGDQRLIGYVVLATGVPPAPQQLRGHLAETLPEYMIPSTFVTISALPLTTNGKIDRGALPAPPQAVGTGAPAALRDPLHQAIAEVWREVLGARAIGVTDSFFDLGGHSLLLVQVHQRLAPLLPRPVNLVDLFRYPTIESLAAHCRSAGAVPRQRDGVPAGGDR